MSRTAIIALLVTLVLFAGALHLFTIAFIAQSQPDPTGMYSIAFESGIYAHDEDICLPPYKVEKGSGFCYEPIDVENELGLLKRPDGDLDFATHLVFFNWHTCSLKGKAVWDDGEWVYTEKDEALPCTLRIRVDGGNVYMAADADARCRAHCGMRGSLDGIIFPISSRQDKQITKADINCIASDSSSCEK